MNDTQSRTRDAIPEAARQRHVLDRQCLGRRLREDPRIAGIRRARDLERRRRRDAGPTRRPHLPRRSARACEGDLRRDVRCRSPRISRKASPMRRPTSPRRSGWPPASAWSAARSRISPATRTTPIFDLGFATERVAAAAEAARALPFPFTLTARAENFLHERHDLDDTIRRLQAYETGRRGRVVRARPAGSRRDPPRLRIGREAGELHGGDPREIVFSVAELAAAGVRRISYATTLYRAAMAGLVGRRARNPRRGHVRLSRSSDAERRLSPSYSRS